MIVATIYGCHWTLDQRIGGSFHPGYAHASWTRRSWEEYLKFAFDIYDKAIIYHALRNGGLV